MPVHHNDDGAVYTCQMTLAGMVQQCNVTLNVTCMYYLANFAQQLAYFGGYSVVMCLPENRYVT